MPRTLPAGPRGRGALGSAHRARSGGRPRWTWPGARGPGGGARRAAVAPGSLGRGHRRAGQRQDAPADRALRAGGRARLPRARRPRRGVGNGAAVRRLGVGARRPRRRARPRAAGAAGGRAHRRAGPGAAVDRAGGAPSGGLQDERYRAHRAVRALLVALAARRPLVVALDDLHWADDASLELVAHLLRRPPRARILCALAFREGQLAPLGARGARGRGARRPRHDAAAGAAVGARSRRPAGAGAARRDPPRGLRAERWQPVLPAGARARRRAARERARRRSWPRSGRRSAASASRRAGSRSAPRSRATRRSSTSRRSPPASTSPPRWPRSTSWSRATCCDRPPPRAATRSATRSCGAPSTRRRARAGGSPRTRGAAARWPGARGALAARAHHVERSARVGDEAAVDVLAGDRRAVRDGARAGGRRRLAVAALRLLPADRRGAAARAARHARPRAGAPGRLEEALDALQEALARCRRR